MDAIETICVKTKTNDGVKIINKIYRYQIFDKHYILTTLEFNTGTFTNFSLNDSITHSGIILIDDKNKLIKTLNKIEDEFVISEEFFKKQLETFFINLTR